MGARSEDFSGLPERRQTGSWLGSVGWSLFSGTMLVFYALALLAGGIVLSAYLIAWAIGADGAGGS